VSRISDLLHRAVARVTLELKSPLHIGSGTEDELLDGLAVRDANGLPSIPGTSLAGALRARYSAITSESMAAELFGDADQEQPVESRVDVSFGHLHNSANTPVPQRIGYGEAEDALLQQARVPVIREHVRIGHRGAIDSTDRGLYSNELVPAGHRFTFELTIYGKSGKDQLDQLLALLQQPSFQLGGHIRRGLGSVRVVELKAAKFNLTDTRDFEKYSRLPVDICVSADDILSTVEIQNPALHADFPTTDIQSLQLSLTPSDFWLIGGGDAGQFELEGEQLPDIVPYTEPRVSWQKDGNHQRGTHGQRQTVVVPGSSIRGALRHRTAFHYNAITGSHASAASGYIDVREDATLVQQYATTDALNELFGTVARHDDKENSRVASRLHVHDVVLNSRPAHKRIQHVSIDRFTQGPIDGALFEEIALWRGQPWQLQFDIHLPQNISAGLSSVLLAFRFAIDDLLSGNLMLGSGAGRGNGYLQGDPPDCWPDCLDKTSLTSALTEPADSDAEAIA